MGERPCLRPHPSGFAGSSEIVIAAYSPFHLEFKLAMRSGLRAPKDVSARHGASGGGSFAMVTGCL